MAVTVSEQCVNSQSQTVTRVYRGMYLFKGSSRYRGRHLVLDRAESVAFMAAEECAFFLPAVLDASAVFESNYSMVGFSRNVCLALRFKERLWESLLGSETSADLWHPAEKVELPLQGIIKGSLTSLCLQRGWVRGDTWHCLV